MAKRTTTSPEPAPTTMRRCVGSERFGIVAHEAPTADFPVQPSGKDGLGRMCKPHWREYTGGLRRDQLARAGGESPVNAERPAREPRAGRVVARPQRAPKPAKAPKPEPARVLAAREKLAATEKLGGAAYTEAIGSDEVQQALATINGAAHGADAEVETPVGEIIDAGTEEADAA